MVDENPKIVHADLETPSSSGSLYAYRGDDAALSRTHFTGDVFEVADGLQILVQHPCALRSGVTLHERLLTAEVRESPAKPRSQWKNHPFSEMPLPELFEASTAHHVVDFDSLSITSSEALNTDARIAVLSQEGVNLLSQRWVYHSSRVVIPTMTFDSQTFGPYNEADLFQEWVEDHPDGLLSATSFDTWVRHGTPSKQVLLNGGQSASAVRRDMRTHLKKLRAGEVPL